MSNDSTYSVKMRASLNGIHISGAERLVSADQVAEVSGSLVQRAMTHPHGVPDEVTVTVAQVIPDDITHISLLPSRTVETSTPEEAMDVIREELADFPAADTAIQLLTSLKRLRGAVLLDAHTGERLEPDQARGIRVSNLDLAGSSTETAKQHHSEARTLASKVLNHPNIVAELCISDDPDYTTGYVATHGEYIRLTNIKEMGSDLGTRVFLYDGPRDDLADTIDYLENHVVMVHE